MSALFGRHTNSNLSVAVRGEGPYIIDENQKKYLDCGDAAVSCLGHNHPKVIAAIKEQIDQIAFAHSGFFTTVAAESLAEKLVENAPDGIDYVYLLSGGSEAVEASIKLARQYFLEIGEPDRHHVIARKQSYHGNTIGALSAGGNEWRRAQFGPLLIQASHISECFEYRGKREGESSFEYGQRVAGELEDEILRVGASKVMAYIAEPVVGATAGAVPPVDGYFKRIKEICQKYGVLLILDEVMCGMGRTGTLFACEQENIVPDIITIAKSLGGGYQPIGAMLCSGKIYGAIKNGSGFFQHGHTYMAHATAAAAALAVLTSIEKEALLPKVRKLGRLLFETLHERFSGHPNVGDIRGRGLFQTIEFVEDKLTKKPFDPKLGIHKKLKVAAMAEGLICYPMGGTIDGVHGDHVLLAPPFILEKNQIGELVDKLERAINAVI